MATATAWLSATTGLSEIRSSSSYSATICGQSVASALGASSWTAAIAAWSWYGPVGPRGSASVISATPSAMCVGVPAAPVLLGHRDQRAVRPGPGRPAGVGEQHQGQQPGHLAVVGQQPVDQAGQPDRLGRQLGAVQARARRAGVALVEDQVEHVQDRAEPFGALRARGHAERDAAVLDALLGPADAPGHGRLRHQERPGDLGGGQAADRPQGQRDLRRRRQRRDGST